MHLLRFQVHDYRNLSRLDLPITAGPSIFIGRNAQGKTNFLEAIYLLATMRAPRADVDSQLIAWAALDGAMPSARVIGDIETHNGMTKMEVIVSGRQQENGGLTATKLVRVNGVPRRRADAIGQFNAVMFAASDLDLVTGSPAMRRRYLDIILSQTDRVYYMARQRYEKVLIQRNHLLKRIREGAAGKNELGYWNEVLAADGAVVIRVRAELVKRLDALAADTQRGLAPKENLQVVYHPRLGDAVALSEFEGERLVAKLRQVIEGGIERDVSAGMTLLGPHRDDLTFLLNDAVASFASRAQQRSIALALRLAEARFLHEHRGESPLLLLDDVMSEMDQERRATLVEAVKGYEQVLITATELDYFPSEFATEASVFKVSAGEVASSAGGLL